MSETLLQARNLSISFGGLKAVQDVDLDVPQGSLTALVGRAVGAGDWAGARRTAEPTPKASGIIRNSSRAEMP